MSNGNQKVADLTIDELRAIIRDELNSVTQGKDKTESPQKSYFNMKAWGNCADPSLKIEDFTGEPCWVGIDIPSATRLAVMMLIFKREDDLYIFGKYYLPEDLIKDGLNSHYFQWASNGLIAMTGDDRIDITPIQDDLMEIACNHEVLQVFHDPFNVARFAALVKDEGFPMVEILHTVSQLSEPMKKLNTMISDGKVYHNDDPVLSWMMSNVIAKVDEKGNVFPRKKSLENEISGAIGIIMALKGATR